MNRASSIYSLRYRTTVPDAVIVRMVEALPVPRQDSHVRVEDGATWAVIGFRAKSDADARWIAERVLSKTSLAPLRAHLFTGFGQARREVVWP